MTLKIPRTKEYIAARSATAAAEWRARNPNGMREVHYKNRYGISFADYTKLLEAQNGLCAVCQNPETAVDQTGKVKGLAIDHCHKTGVIRGLLCSRCNHMLGHARDNTEILRKAIGYLETADTGFKTQVYIPLKDGAAAAFLDELENL